MASRSRLRGHGISRDLGKKPLEDDFQGSKSNDDVKFSVGCAVYDRGEAIHLACSSASPRDFVVIAGRGHEKFILSNGEMQPFDDLVVLHECALHMIADVHPRGSQTQAQ